MLGVILISLAQPAVAFATLDLFFRYMDLDAEELPKRVRRYGVWYGLIALVCSVVGAWGQWGLAGAPGLAIGGLNWVTWWMLWRFGLRKQFTYLFKADGGSPVDVTKPNP